MRYNDKEAVQVLTEIIDAVETLSLNDDDAWHGLHQKLEIFFLSVPLDKENLADGLRICNDAIFEIANANVSNPLTMVDALYDVLDTVINHLTEENGDVEDLAQKKLILHKLVKEARNSGESDQLAPPPGNGTAETATVHNLNDVAMMLIQLEPEEKEALDALKAAITGMVGSDTISEVVKEKISQTLPVIDAISPDEEDGWDNHISTISALIDGALLLENQTVHSADEPPAVAHLEDKEIPEIPMDEINDNDLPANEMPEDEPAMSRTETVSGMPKEEETTGEMSPEPMEREEQMDSPESTDKEIPKAAAEPDPSQEVDEKDYMPEDADLEMLGEFISESNELITNAEEALLSLEVDPDDKDAIGTVFRAFHTVKGTAAFLELDLLSEMAHHAENLLSRVRDGEIRYSGGYADLSLKALDMIKELVGFVENALSGEALKKPLGYDELLKTLSNPEAEGISEEFDEDVSYRVGDILVASGKVKREELEETVTKYADKPVGEALVQSKISKVQDVGQALRTQTKLKGGSKHTVDSTVRVSTKRLDKLVDMVGEMVIAHSMIAQDEIVSHSQNHALLKKVTQTGKIVRELQDLSMSMRMIPLKATFQKMARLVRDVGRKVGKNVNLITEGEDTEIDRNLVDFINDPLVHMVRNSVDHGIESPEEREQAGKSPQGTIKLSAYHSAGNVVVEISDDGKGLNKELILQKAIERSLIEKGKTLSDKEIYNLIFEPGFSTAQTVTDVSGRGVGMDVVRKNIETLRGQVEINSEAGKGSVFKINLPLTLAIIDGMVIRVASESYVLPTESIVRSIKPEPGQISTVFNEGKVLTIQGQLIPLFPLSRLYDIKQKEKEADEALVVIVEDDTTRAGIIIDELVGRQQVVVKSLGETMKGIPGISGGAIMPNGRVGLIIDVGGLIRMIHSGFDKLKESENLEDVQMAV